MYVSCPPCTSFNMLSGCCCCDLFRSIIKMKEIGRSFLSHTEEYIGAIQQYAETQDRSWPPFVREAHCTLVYVSAGLFQATVPPARAVRRSFTKAD